MANRTSLSKVIEENLDYLVCFACFQLGNKAEAEDAVYEAVLRLLEKDMSAINPGSLRLYLFRMVYNLCTDRRRAGATSRIPVESVDVEDDTEAALDMEEADRINAFLNELPEREAEIIRMNVIDGLTFVEIGRILAIPSSTAKSRYRTGMERLRNRLKDCKI